MGFNYWGLECVTNLYRHLTVTHHYAAMQECLDRATIEQQEMEIDVLKKC